MTAWFGALVTLCDVGKQRVSSTSAFGSRERIFPPPYLANLMSSSFGGWGGQNSP